MIRQLKLFYSIAFFEAKRFSIYPLELASGVAIGIFEVIFIIVFWTIAGKYSTKVHVDIAQTIRYFLVVAGIQPFFFLGYGIANMVMKQIKSGELNQLLLRPIHPFYYLWAVRTGRNALGYFTGVIYIIVGITLTVIKVGQPNWLIVAWTFCNALVIGISLNMLVSCLSFYIVEATGLKNTAVHISRLLRGGLVPLYVLSAFTQNMFQLTPFPASMYHIVSALIGNPVDPRYILVGSAWAIVLTFVAIKTWNISIKNYEAVGA